MYGGVQGACGTDMMRGKDEIDRPLLTTDDMQAMDCAVSVQTAGKGAAPSSSWRKSQDVWESGIAR